MKSVDAAVRPFQSVLCPVDFSSNSRVALQHAVALVGRTGGRLTVMYVDDPLLGAAWAAGYDERLLTKMTTRELRRLLARVGTPAGFDPDAANVEHAFGRPWREIVKTARRIKVDLVVMGTRGRSGASKLFFGSTTEAVLRHAPMPILAVSGADGARVPKKWPGTHILGAVELTRQSRADVKAMAEVARAFGCDLTLAHVVSSTPGPPWLAPQLSAQDRKRLNAARTRLRQLAADVPGPAVKSCVLLGNPAEEVPALAVDIHASLVVLKLRRGHGLFAEKQGSTTYRILCGSKPPVLALT